MCGGCSRIAGVRPLTNPAIKMLVNTAKIIDNTHLMYSYIHSYCLEHSFYGKAHGTRVSGHRPNHILGNINIALTLVSLVVYSGSAWHFDPPTQKALNVPL